MGAHVCGLAGSTGFGQEGDKRKAGRERREKKGREEGREEGQ